MRFMGSVTAVVLAACSVTASAAAAQTASAQAGTLTLSIVEQLTGKTTIATLTCDPVGGTHPDGVAACADLTAAAGDIAQIPPESAICAADYWPVTAQATGTWQGAPLGYSKSFANACYADIATGGHVFHF